MPTLSSMFISSGSVVSSEDIYSGGLFEPKATPTTLEILNGGLDEANYGAGIGTIEPYMCQYGSFAIGYYSGFTKDHKVFANTVSRNIGTNEKQHHIHTELSATIYLPWAPSVLLYGYQAFFQHDATIWDVNGTPVEEDWAIQLGRAPAGSDQTLKKESKMLLPWGRASNIAATAAGGSAVEHDEQRWRYVNKHQTETSVVKGYHSFEVQVLAKGIAFPDKNRSKVKTVIGSFYALALR